MAFGENIEKISSITLECHDVDTGSSYGTEKLAEWYVKNHGNGSITVEDVKAHEYDNEIKEIIEQAILDNATVYDEKARKYYNQTVRSYTGDGLL